MGKQRQRGENRYDDESEAALRAVIGPETEEADAMSEGEKRAQAIDDFLARTKDFYDSLGVTHGLSRYAETNEELRDILYEAQIEKMAERGLL